MPQKALMAKSSIAKIGKVIMPPPRLGQSPLSCFDLLIATNLPLSKIVFSFFLYLIIKTSFEENNILI